MKNLDKIPTRESIPEPATEPEVATKARKVKIICKISSLKLRENFKRN